MDDSTNKTTEIIIKGSNLRNSNMIWQTCNVYRLQYHGWTQVAVVEFYDEDT